MQRRRLGASIARAAGNGPQQQQQTPQAPPSRGPLASVASLDEGDEVPILTVSGVRMAPRGAQQQRRLGSPAASLASLSSLASLASLSSVDFESGVNGAAAANGGGALFRFSPQQIDLIRGLRGSMVSCSNAFFGVAAASVLLSAVAAAGGEGGEALEAAEAPARVLFSGITVGDVASWVDSLLVAGLLRFGAESFARAADSAAASASGDADSSSGSGENSSSSTSSSTSSSSGSGATAAAAAGKELAYTFQGINRLGLLFEQLAVAAATVSIVITLEAAAEWPPLVTLASGLFFTAAVARSASMWWVLSKYGKRLDDVEESLEAHRRIVQAARSEPDAFPLLDRIAIRVAFIYLLQFEAAGRRGGGQALAAAPPRTPAATRRRRTLLLLAHRGDQGPALLALHPEALEPGRVGLHHRGRLLRQDACGRATGQGRGRGLGARGAPRPPAPPGCLRAAQGGLGGTTLRCGLPPAPRQPRGPGQLLRLARARGRRDAPESPSRPPGLV